MTYTVRIAAAPAKFLENVRDRSLVLRLTRAMRSLGDNPPPFGCVKMAGEECLYRIRVGDYRIIYQIHDDVVLVLGVAIGHRREVYR